MTTRANLLLGADYEGVGEGYCHTLLNYMKNHWRMSDPCTNLIQVVPGMIVSDEDDNKVYHITDLSAPCSEVLQEELSQDTTPIFSALQLDVDDAAVTDPPTDAELDALYTSPAAVGSGWHKFLNNTNSGGDTYLILSDGSNWYTLQFTLAV